MDLSDDRHATAALYNGLDSAELEALPEALVVHHATPYPSDSGLPLRRVVRPLGLRSLCERRVDVVIPTPFDLADPYACARCVAVVSAGPARGAGDPS